MTLLCVLLPQPYVYKQKLKKVSERLDEWLLVGCMPDCLHLLACLTMSRCSYWYFVWTSGVVYLITDNHCGCGVGILWADHVDSYWSLMLVWTIAGALHFRSCITWTIYNINSCCTDGRHYMFSLYCYWYCVWCLWYRVLSLLCTLLVVLLSIVHLSLLWAKCVFFALSRTALVSVSYHLYKKKV